MNSLIRPETPEAYKLLHDGMLALIRAERHGIHVDVQAAEELKAHMVRKMERMEKNFRQTEFFEKWQESSKKGEVNINSGQQLGYYLYNILGLEPAKLTDTGKGSVDKDALKALGIKDLDFYANRTGYKKAHDVLSGFIRESVDGYMHPAFNLHTVVTYRSSSNDPNFQNIPARDKEIANICRSVILPSPGNRLLEADFKSVEVGISACVNKDPKLIKYVSGQGDMHGDMMQQIFMFDKFDSSSAAHKHLRKATKNGFVFPQFYGDYFKNNATSLAVEWCGLGKGKWKAHQGTDLMQGIDPPLHKYHISDHLIKHGIKEYGKEDKTKGKWVYTGFLKHLKEIEDDFWNNRFPVYKKWKEDMYAKYQRQGYVDLHTGFRCWGPMRKNEATNYPVQGPAFHCLLKAFIEVDRIARKERWKSKLIGQIHDSMILDVHPSEFEHVVKTVQYVTSVWLREQWKWIIVPISVEMEATDIDQPWNTKKEICTTCGHYLVNGECVHCVKKAA